MSSFVRGWKQAILVSFNLATSDSRRAGAEACDQLRFYQFKRLLLGLKQYFDYLITFSNIDRDNDRTLTFSEFS